MQEDSNLEIIIEVCFPLSWSWSWSWSWAILFDYLVNINRDAHPVLLVIHIPTSIHIRSNNKIDSVRPSLMLFPWVFQSYVGLYLLYLHRLFPSPFLSEQGFL